MLTAAYLRALGQADMAGVSIDQLADAGSVDVGGDGPADARARQYVDAIKNPYLFRVGGTKVKLVFAGGDRTLPDAMKSYLKTLME